MPRKTLIVSLLLFAAFSAVRADAQELEPRAYSPNPVGANFVIAGYTYQDGDVIFDPSLPFSDVKAQVNGATLGYGRTFGFFGRSASASIAVPYAWGSMQGDVGEVFQSITRSGLADVRAKLAVNLIGGPALTPKEFAARKPAATLGASISVVAPTGEYYPEKLINIGANRWAVKPELGLSYPKGPWTLELYGGVWIFADNTDFYGGKLKEQDPLWAVQGHAGYTFKPRMWLAFDATYYTGGRTTTDGVPGDSRLDNSRAGLTFAYPVTRQQSLKLAFATGASTRVGSKFNTYAIAWQYLWFDKK